jgi:hypothetical protein
VRTRIIAAAALIALLSAACTSVAPSERQE